MPWTSHFDLTKWYMDCVDDSGHAVILYCADIHWRGVRTGVASILESRPGADPHTHTSLGKYQLRSDGNSIAIEHPRLKIAGEWTVAAPAFERTLYEDGEGAVTWNCIQPASRARVCVDGREIASLGYAECLRLTLPPWRLPLRQLRWGRFVSTEHSLVWIGWEGSYAVNLALCDGEPRNLDSASESSVTAGDAELRIEPGISLRHGRLRNTILPGAQALGRLFPRSLFNVVETKWLSRATLRFAGGETSGWTIHELVQWGEVS